MTPATTPGARAKNSEEPAAALVRSTGALSPRSLLIFTDTPAAAHQADRPKINRLLLLQEARDGLEAPVRGDPGEVLADRRGAGGAGQRPGEAHDVVVGVGAECELEAVARELCLRGADHRRQLLRAGARHQWVEVRPVLGPGLRDELASAVRVAFVPGGDVVGNGGVRHGRQGARVR